MDIEPITGFLSRRNQFDLDGDSQVSPDESRTFDALNADPDDFLTFRDATMVTGAFTPERQRAVDRLLEASDTYRRKYQDGLRANSFSGLFTNAANRARSESAARLAYAFAPPNTEQKSRAGVMLRALDASPAKPMLP